MPRPASLSSYARRQRRLIERLRAVLRRGAYAGSIVPKQGAYATDPGRCLTSVTFPPVEIQREIAQVLQAPLRSLEPHHYYYTPASLHLTVKNVRAVSSPPRFDERDARRAAAVFRDIVPQYPALRFCFEEVVMFPTSLAWVGTSDEAFGELVKALDRGLREAGLPDDKHYLSCEVVFASVTICRFTREPGSRLFAAVGGDRLRLDASFVADTVQLLSCNAVCAVRSRRVLGTYHMRNRDRRVSKHFAANVVGPPNDQTPRQHRAATGLRCLRRSRRNSA